MRFFIGLRNGLIVSLFMWAVLASVVFAEQVYVKSNAELEEVVAPEPFVVTPEIKQYLNANAPTHPRYGVKYLTRYIAKCILKVSGREAQLVLEALIEDGNVMTYSERYNMLWGEEEAP